MKVRQIFGTQQSVVLALVGDDLLCQITLVKRMANRSEPGQSIGTGCQFLITQKL